MAAVITHLVVGLWLSPEWLFSKYPDAIRLLREGRLGGEASADYSPLYFLLNRLFAPEALRGIQAITGALGVWGTSRIAQNLSGNAAAVIAAWLVALCAPILAYEATLEPDLLIAVLEIIALWALCVPCAARRHLMVAGVSLGLATALRPSGLMLVTMVSAALLIMGRTPLRSRARAAGILLLVGGGVSIALILGLRALHGGETRATMSVGAVLHMGNRPEGTGFGAHPPHLIKLIEAQERSFANPDAAHDLYRRFARHAATQAELGQAATEDYWVGRALAFVREEPAAYLALQGRKLQAYLFGPFAHDISIVRDLSHRAEGGPAPVSVQVLALLGLPGVLWMLLRPGRTRVLLLLVFFASHVALSLIFYVVARYQLPVLALLSVSSGILVAELPGVVRTRAAHWMPPVLISVLVFLLVGWSVGATSRRARALSRGQAGGVAMRAFYQARTLGDGPTATRAFVDAQAAQPFLRLTSDLRGVDLTDPELLRRSVATSIDRFGLETPMDSLFTAQLLVMAGDCEHALPLLEELSGSPAAWAVYERSIDPDLLAADCLRRTGRTTDAIAHIERAMERRPGAIDPLAQRYASAMALDDATVVDVTRARIFRLHDPLSAGYVVAEALLVWSQPQAALELAERVLEALPSAAVVHYQRALALAQLGRSAEALAAFNRATLLFPRHPFDVGPLEDTLQRVLAKDAFDPDTLGIAAEYSLRRGNWRAAREYLDHASSLYGYAPTREHELRLRLLRSLSEGG